MPDTPKEKKESEESEESKPSYYYDDAHGYEDYEPKDEDEEECQ